MATVQIESQSLTRYTLGSFRELGSIAWPLVLSLLFLCLLNLCDRFFLSRHSLQALEACGSASYLAGLFQIPCMKITSMAQVFVGQYKGSQQSQKIGEVIWQMIWFSFLTMLLTVPLGLLAGSYFFDGTSVKELGLSYFHCLIFANFLFPLGAALTAFFTGQGQTRVVAWTVAVSLLVHVGLDLAFIFGIPGIVPALGIFGAALATVITQALYCLILFALFIQKKESELYGTRNWQIRKDSMWKGIQLGIPRAIARAVTLAAWAAAVRILTQLGDDYLLVLSITGSFCIFFSCLSEGFGQSLITVVSYIIGRGKEKRLLSATKSAFIGFFCNMGILAIFLILFPDKLLKLFYPQPLSPPELSVLIYSCYGLWLFFLFEGLSWIGLSILTAFGETKFLMIYSTATVWFFNYLPLYFAFCFLSLPAQSLWYLMAIPCLTSALAYFLRIWKRFKAFVRDEDSVLCPLKKEDLEENASPY